MSASTHSLHFPHLPTSPNPQRLFLYAGGPLLYRSRVKRVYGNRSWGLTGPLWGWGRNPLRSRRCLTTALAPPLGEWGPVSSPSPPCVPPTGRYEAFVSLGQYEVLANVVGMKR